MTTMAQQEARPHTKEVTVELLDIWATDPKGPVALHLKQTLLPVEGAGGVIFPPTYADIGYNIDTLSDGTRVATIDSIGSQANRMEPIFKASGDGQRENVLAGLIPQIEIVLHSEEKRSILDLAHRGADAVVQASPTLATDMAKAFEALRRTGNAALLCTLAPTSLVFGVWDSRGGTGEKRPRLVRAIIRAWDVEPLHAAAQFNSAWKALSEQQRAELEKEAKAKKTKLSEKGLADAPATFRKVGTSAAKYLQEFRDGAPNPERRVLGGVLAKGRIEREVTVNLVALRGLRGEGDEETKQVRKYLLGLSLLAATADIDLFLREGCHLRYTGEDVWHSVPRRGEPEEVDLASEPARALVLNYASAAAKHFEARRPKTLLHNFSLTEAKKLLAKKDEETPAAE
ncbi:MAG: type I-U CRISPR-associated protein Cas7 [Chloroflexi bacterium]|nr:type I-U CRISPR-associated protein Cas7 [Chloroflexota bacterium]